jgi:carboxymethylenebutenolidase
MAEMIQFKRPDGKDCPGYLATPQAGAGAPAIVVIQEWWGVNPQIKQIAERFAQAGYRALVPDLFRGKIAQDAGEASHLMTSLNFLDAAEQDVRGAAQFLKQSSAKVAIGGFCMGGALTIISAVKVPEMDAGLCFYGIPPAQVADPKNIRVPVIYHFADQDDWCTPAAVDQLEAAVKASGAQYELYRYDAKHAFMNEARSDVYDKASADVAWQRTLTFLKKTIG